MRVPSLANTFSQPKNPPVPGTVQKGVANEQASKGTSSYCRDLHLPLQHLRLQNRHAYEESQWAIPPLTVVERVPKGFDKLHNHTQTAADAVPNHSLVAVLYFVGIAPAGSLLPRLYKAASSDPS